MNEQLIEEIMKNFEQHIAYSKLAIYGIIEKNLSDKLIINKKVVEELIEFKKYLPTQDLINKFESLLD